MDAPSVFQQQAPLSPKKMTKKMLQKFISGIFIFLGVGIAASVGAFAIVTGIMGGNPVSGNESGPLAAVLTFAGIGFGFSLLICLIRLAIYYLYYRAYIRRYYYDCGDQFVTIQKGVFAPTEIHVQYPKIQDVYVDQDVLDRFLGIYDVHIASATATSGIEAHIDGVDKPVAEYLKNLILYNIQHGSGGASAAPPAAVPAAGAAAAAQAASVPANVSSIVYPFDKKWKAYSTLQAAFSTFVILLFLGLVFFRGCSGTGSFALGAILAFIFYGGLYLAVFVIQLVSVRIWTKNFYFEFAPDYILLRTGVISKSENHLPYRTIQDVILSQGMIERWFGLATLTIQNAAAAQMMNTRNRSMRGFNAGLRIVGRPKAKAEELKQIITGIISSIQHNQGAGTGL